MAEPFLAEIRIFSFVFAPRGWALCNGQLLPINQNQALFSLLGTTFGGDGRVNFALPNLQARVPIHTGGSFTLGQNGGEAAHTLTIPEMPQHQHNLKVSQDSNANNTTGAPNNFFGTPADNSTMYFSGTADSQMIGTTISNIGGSQAHENRQPFLTLSFCIALQGIFPSPN